MADPTDRRRFFHLLLGGGTSLAAGPTILAATPSVPTAAHLREHPLSGLAAFNQQFLGYQHAEAIHPQWGVFFTGLKVHHAQTELVGQWLGWAGPWVPLEERRRIARYFYAPVPGSAAYEYRKGDVFRTEPGIALEDFLTADGPDHARALVEAGRARLIAYMRERI